MNEDANYYAIFSETIAYLVTFNNGDNELSSSFVTSAAKIYAPGRLSSHDIGPVDPEYFFG